MTDFTQDGNSQPDWVRKRGLNPGLMLQHCWPDLLVKQYWNVYHSMLGDVGQTCLFQSRTQGPQVVSRWSPGKTLE